MFPFSGQRPRDDARAPRTASCAWSRAPTTTWCSASQAVGAGVSELSAAFALALEMGARLEDIGGTIHAHPTLGEAFQEAACARWATRFTSSAQLQLAVRWGPIARVR